MKYNGNFNANNGTRLMNDMESNNKFELNNYLRESTIGETFAGSNGSWTVFDSKGNCVFHGIVDGKGNVQYITYNGESKF